jgi:sec-independent protein translocase protein TatA
MFGIGPAEMVIVLILAVILFGNRLPSVARSLGKSMVEFKKGMRDFEDEVKNSIYSDPPNRVTYQDRSEPPAPPRTEQPVAAAPPTPHEQTSDTTAH